MGDQMKKLIFALLVIAVLIMGCSSQTVYKDDKTTVTSDSSGKTVTSTTTTDKGTITSEGTIGKDGWCAEGTDWKWSSDVESGMGSGTMVIDRIMTSGKYSGLCHVVYTFNGPEGQAQWDYYFSEDGDSGYVVMDINGQKIEQEWHS